MQACGCLFHLKHVVRRNLSQKGLITFYDSCHRFQYLIHMLYSFVFVLVPRVVEIYDTVIRGLLDENTNEEGIVDNLEAVEEFLTYEEGIVDNLEAVEESLTYFENTWLGHQVNWHLFFLFPVFLKILSHDIVFFWFYKTN
jgi:hypothetical protein